ncbi:MAG: SH3 domain-containing protein, partial [Candidatus Riflebacteria bacterium]|nr:SH3 domain-containing protein [Candidatus Riflebacteria bacterium]
MKPIGKLLIMGLAVLLCDMPASASTPFSETSVKIQSSANADADKAAKAAVDKDKKAVTGTVALADVLNIRSAPWGDIIGTVKKGDKVSIIGASGDWYKVSVNGKTAYVHSAYVLKAGEKAKPFPNTGYVNTFALNVRRVPHGDILSQIKQGDKVNILGVAGDWYKISWNGNEAFVAKRYIDNKKTTPAPANPYNFTGYVTASALNVRTAPWGKIDTTIPNGIAVKVIGKEGDWYKIDYNGKTRYVHASYISKTKGASSSGNTSTPATTASGTLQKRIVAEAKKLVGSTAFRTSDVAGGRLACAKVVTTALKNAGALSQVHLNCRSTVTDLKSKGWKEVKVPPFAEGDVITWKTYDYTGDGIKDPDTHIGIIIKEGNSYKAMNN